MKFYRIRFNEYFDKGKITFLIAENEREARMKIAAQTGTRFENVEAIEELPMNKVNLSDLSVEDFSIVLKGIMKNEIQAEKQ